MKGLDVLNLTNDITTEIKKRSANYYRNFGVSFEIKKSNKGKIEVVITHEKLIFGIHTKDKLAELARDFITDYIEDYHIKCEPFTPNFEKLTIEWLKEKRKKHKLTQGQVGKIINQDKSYISNLEKGTYSFSKPMRSALFYHFYVIELTESITEVMEKNK